jgi:hypothetical protein
MNDTKSNGGRDAHSGRFTAGNHIARGRQGSRNRLSERFLHDLHVKWKKHGSAVLERIIATEPATFAKIISHVLPREAVLDATLTVDNNLFVECRNFAEAFRLARDHIGADEPLMIEGEVEATDAD